MQLNYVDFAIIGMVVISIFFGFRKGLIEEIFWLSGIVIGVVLAAYYQDNVISYVKARWDLPLFENAAGIFIVILLFTILIFSISGRLFTFFTRRHLSLTLGNRLGGAFFGLARGIIVAGLISVLILKMPFPANVNMQIYQSEFSPLILRYSLKLYDEILHFLPKKKTFAHIDVDSLLLTKEKIGQLENTPDLTIFQDFLNNIIEDKEKMVPKRIREIKREEKK